MSDDEMADLAELLSSLPVVSSPSDVESLSADALGVRAESLTNELLALLAEHAPTLRYVAGDGNSHVTDAGLSALAQFSRLESLDLEWSAITDAGLDKSQLYVRCSG